MLLRLSCLVTLAATLVVGPGLAGSHASAGAACQGRAVTIVGTPGGTVTGTDGADVIDTNGAVSVDARGGNDRVCVSSPTEPSRLDLDTGAGNDRLVVDEGSRGRWMLGTGDDVVELAARHPGAVVAGGAGVDRALMQVVRTGSLGSADGDVALDLGEGTLRLEGATPIRISGLDRWSFVAGGQAVVRGSAGPDHVTAQACRLTMYGGSGSDTLTADVTGGFHEVTGCYERRESRLVGGPHGDRVTGIDDHTDVLGGTGADRVTLWGSFSRAFGQDGDDVMRGVGLTDDLFNGGNGNDYVDAEAGNDIVLGGPGNDRALRRQRS